MSELGRLVGPHLQEQEEEGTLATLFGGGIFAIIWIKILFSCALATYASISISGHRSTGTLAQLVIATGVVIFVVMAAVPVLVYIVVCTQLGVRLVEWISMALIIQVIGVLAM